MTLKDDLLRNGYLPENLPPAFDTAEVADYFQANEPTGYLSHRDRPLRPATYNASKRGLTRRVFSAVHPETAHDMAEFVSNRWDQIAHFLRQSTISFSIPEHRDDTDRALAIHSHMRLEEEKLNRLSSYRFIATTDISRFYHSIYTHSIPWAFHGKLASKADRRTQSARVFFNRADFIIRNGQDGQTVGIPVGPDMSRVFAEVIATAIDLEFQRRLEDINCIAIRHVDDVWIGANSHADAERALYRYREAIREFELDINESKTRILSEGFSFSDFWPSEISAQIDFALQSGERKSRERLRSAFEYAFSLAARENDDGILKYILRYIDQNGLSISHWEVAEPFLKRVAVHFGHTIDYVTRILVWRHLSQGDLDTDAWAPILGSILEKHGRLGNDSEVCWTIYALQRLGIVLAERTAARILQNCSALSLIAALHCVELNLAPRQIFQTAVERLGGENANGRFWPVLLEWKSRGWEGHAGLSLDNETIESLSDSWVVLYRPERVPPVFQDVDVDEFGQVSSAIESGSSMYDEEPADDEADNSEVDLF